MVLRQFVRFLLVAAVLGVASVAVLESVEWIFRIRHPVAHGVLVSVIYLAGVYINFHLQKGWVFRTTGNASLLLYAAWMVFSAGVVGVLSGLIYGALESWRPGLPFVASVSLVTALCINAPVTFYGVRFIMQGKGDP